MRRPAAVLTLLVAGALPLPARGQVLECASPERANRKLAGHIIDYTHNHGADRRLYSPILGRPRDMYVYLPPGYTPARAYSLILYFHLAYVDEHVFPGTPWIVEFDEMVCSGCAVPAIVVCVDGTIDGRNRINAPHSMYINGCLGRFEDHILAEVLPFLSRTYSVRPEREAHALFGISAGGYGAMSLALRHRDIFGAVATLAAPLNLRYSTVDGNYHEDFDPATFRWKTEYDPEEPVGRFYFGLKRVPARKYMEPVFGNGPGVPQRVMQTNPADLLLTTDLCPGELAMFVNYGGRDNWNFDAQNESFLWLASLKGITVTIDNDPPGQHDLPYFNRNHRRAYAWLGRHVLPPTAVPPGR
jgi:hypothetical protein